MPFFFIVLSTSSIKTSVVDPMCIRIQHLRLMRTRIQFRILIQGYDDQKFYSTAEKKINFFFKKCNFFFHEGRLSNWRSL
jgi:hypothetical protein